LLLENLPHETSSLIRTISFNNPGDWKVSKKIVWWIVGIVAVLLLGAALWGPIASNVEHPKYKVAEHIGNIEIRDYAPMIVAEADVKGERREAVSKGFRIIADYTKQGNRYLRWLLVAGAMAVIRYARQHGTKRLWLTRIMGRRLAKVAAAALANKIARMAWAIMVRSERCKEPTLSLAA
jgi:SOUL heme-binding protein